MNRYSQNVKADMDSFQNAVEKLSRELQAVSDLWKDEKYKSLSAGIADIARQSRDVLAAGDRLCGTVERFFRIAEEEY